VTSLVTSSISCQGNPLKGQSRRPQQPWCFKDGITREQQKEADRHIFVSFISKHKSLCSLSFKEKKKEEVQFNVFQGKNRLQVFQLQNINIYLMLSQNAAFYMQFSM